MGVPNLPFEGQTQATRHCGTKSSPPRFAGVPDTMKFAVALVCLVCAAVVGADAAATYTPPFSRLLTVQQPPLVGVDVNVTQHLLVRDPAVGAGGLTMTGQYDPATASAVQAFQKGASCGGIRGRVRRVAPVYAHAHSMSLLCHCTLHSCSSWSERGRRSGAGDVQPPSRAAHRRWLRGRWQASCGPGVPVQGAVRDAGGMRCKERRIGWGRDSLTRACVW